MFFSKFFRHRYSNGTSLVAMFMLFGFLVIGSKRSKDLGEPKSSNEVKISGPVSAKAQSADADATALEFESDPRFDKFMKFIGIKLKAFQKDHMPLAESVFYPFGGPDLLYPLILFPDALTYVLVGLELPGENLKPDYKDLALDNLSSLLQRGFFVTANMNKTYNHQVGVRATLAMQILLMGGKILDDSLSDPNTASISFLLFGQEKTVFYLRRNLVDGAESMFEFLDQHNVHDACLMKASSYSLHRPIFAGLKTRILESFSTVVQDDTGIPVDNLSAFDIKVFGRYTKPYGVEWRGYEQPALKKLFDTDYEPSRLNFCFGYGCGQVEANLLIAKRKV